MPRKRKNSFVVRMTDAELEKLDKQVFKSGLSREAYARSVLTSSVVPKPMPPETFHTVIFHLRRIGNNMNQIARIANTTGEIDARQYRENVTSLNQEILELRKKMIE